MVQALYPSSTQACLLLGDSEGPVRNTAVKHACDILHLFLQIGTAACKAQLQASMVATQSKVAV